MNKNTKNTLTFNSFSSLTDDELVSSFRELLNYLETDDAEVEKVSEIIVQRIEAVGSNVIETILSPKLSIYLKDKLLRCCFQSNKENKFKMYNHCASLLYRLAYNNCKTSLEIMDTAKSILSDLQSYYSTPTIENAEIIIPSHKSDFEKALLIDMSSIEVIKLVKNQLFDWIADSNWPIAQCIIYILVSRFNETKELYAEFLSKGVDDNYDIGISYSLLSTFWCFKNRSEWSDLKDELSRIAFNPSKNEQSEELDNYAKEILDCLRVDVC